MKQALTIISIFAACVVLHAQPANNTFSNATELTNISGWTSSDAAYTTVSATADGSSGSCTTAYKNVWFKFQATTTEIELKVTTGSAKGTLQYPVLTFYNSSGTAISCKASSTAAGVAFIQTTSLTSGNWYYLSVDSPSNSTYPGTFTLSATSSIGYDLKEKATEITFTSNAFTSSDAAYSTVNATPDATSGSCVTIYRNVWFKFQAATTELEVRVLIGGTKGTMLFPTITLYNSSGTAIQCAGVVSAQNLSFIQTTSLATGDWYYFSVDTPTNSGYPGSFTLTAANTVGNDLFSKAQTLTLSSHSYVSADGAFTTASATPDGTAGSCNGVYKNVWFKFQAGSTDMEIKVLNGGGKGTMGVGILTLYNSSGTPIQCHMASGTAFIQTTTLTAGSWYYLSVDSFNNASYPGTFTLTLTDQISFDLRTKAFQLSSDSWTSADAAYSNVTATADGASGSCSNVFRNVWFSFQPTTNAPEIKLTTGGSKGTMQFPVLTLYNSAGTVIQCVYPGIQTGTASLRTSGLDPTAQYYFTADNAVNVTYAGTFTIEVNNGIANALNAWGFMYKYDARERMTQKKVPGADWVYMVYDDRDRLVMTQDGNQRAAATKYWSFTKYDPLNRPIMTGIWNTTTAYSQESMQAAIDSYYSGGGSAQFYETYVGTATGNVHGYSNNSFPNNTSSAGETDPFKYLSVTYYDNYSFTSLLTRDYTYVPDGLSETVNSITYTQPSTPSGSVTGQVTGQKTKVLDGGVTGGYTWLNTVNYYDDKYRIIQVLSDNYKGGTDIVSNVVDFTGRILKTKATHFTNNVTWTDNTNVQQLGNKLIGYPPTNWTAGAASREVLPAGVNGWMEFTVSESSRKIVGLNDSNSGGTSASDIDYAFQLNSGGLTVQQGSTVVASIGTISSGDVLRIERQGTTITFKRNNITIPYNAGTTPIASTTALMVDNSFYLSGNAITGVRTSFSQRSKSITRHFVYDHVGRVLQVTHKIDSGPEVVITKNEYNELGQLVDKQLHSVSGSDFKQSIDYRYNIRGWLTSINNSQVWNDSGATNDDSGDLFGMELGYNNSINTSNTPMYNGNISGIKWSKNMALNPTSKDIAYNYSYDTLNRIKGAQYRKNIAGSWSNANAFSESNYKYDLNGNILSLIRNDSSGTAIDNLTYNYGAPGSRTNRLLSVTDAADNNAGFKEFDSSNSLDDYVYDANGNMLWDRNKGGTELLTNGSFDSGNAGWTLTDTGSRISFATAGQATFVAGSATAVLTQTGIIKPNAPHVLIIEITRTSGTGNVTVSVGGSGTTVTNGSITMSMTSGAGADFTMTATAGFVGYISSVSIRGLTAITYNFLNLPEQVSNAKNSLMQYIYDAGGRKLTQHVYGQVTDLKKATDYNGEYIYQNDTLQFINTEEGRVVMTGTSPEYQYHLKDHLGNVRLTFTTKPDTESDRATLETDSLNHDQSKFLEVEKARRINARIFDHTYNGTTPTNGAYATRLTGSANERIGLARSLSVMPGDIITAEVYAKYVDPTATNDNALMDVLAAIAGSGSVPGGTYVDGSGYSGAGTANYPFTGFFAPSDTSTAPKAYMNYIVFDRNFHMRNHGFKRISSAAQETGDVGNHTGLAYEGVAHERLAFENGSAIVIKEPGYVYIWLSNEESTPVEVFFDDFKVTHTKSPVIQSDDYYPFGLSFNEYQRENSLVNNFQYNGKEKQDELNLGWLDYGARMYMPEIGRWGAVDPMSEKSRRWTPYNYAYNNPMRFIDLDGMFAFNPYLLFKGDEKKLEVWDDNDTPDDDSDDLLLSSNDAKNETTNSSNGKWEDGEYDMEDTETPHMHGNEVDSSNIPKDSDNGAYGSGGIYRAKNFEQTTPSMTRSGMGVHAGRENADWETGRKTQGCIRVKPEGFDKIGEAIDEKGSLTKIVVQNNRPSTNSATVNAKKPGSAYLNQAQNAHELAVEESTRIMQ